MPGYFFFKHLVHSIGWILFWVWIFSKIQTYHKQMKIKEENFNNLLQAFKNIVLYFAIILEFFSTLVRDVLDRLQGTLSRTVWRVCLRNLKFPHFYSWWFTDNTSSSEWRCTTQLTMFYGGRKHSLLGKVHLKKELGEESFAPESVSPLFWS